MRYVLVALLMMLGLTACDNDARTVSRNLSTAADQFEINRRIIFYNGITNDYMLSIEGYCSQEHTQGKLAVTCKVGPGREDFKKHFLGLSDNVTYFSEQIDPVKASRYHYRVIFKPTSIVPDIDINFQ